MLDFDVKLNKNFRGQLYKNNVCIFDSQEEGFDKFTLIKESDEVINLKYEEFEDSSIDARLYVKYISYDLDFEGELKEEVFDIIYY